jgi:7-keto-8-aminopelargonate synthetase-like enzyme
VGVDLSRSKVYYYKHNDLADLELVLKKIAKDVARLGRDVTQQVG